MINCVSCVIPSGTSVNTNTQLVNSIIPRITNFIYRFIQCSQNTVVSLMGSIQYCIFLKNWQDFLYTCERLAVSDGIICAQRNRRNIHEYLTEIKKSEENLQYSKQHVLLEASSDNNYNNFNNAKKQTRAENTIIFIMISGIIKDLFLQRPTIFFIIK